MNDQIQYGLNIASAIKEILDIIQNKDKIKLILPIIEKLIDKECDLNIPI